MAKETQKQIIERLESEITLKNDKVNKLLDLLDQKQSYIDNLIDKSDDLFANSADKKQLEKKMKVLEDSLFFKNNKINTLEKRLEEKQKYIHKLINKQTESTSNARGAGRKVKLNNKQIKEIIELRKKGETVRNIAAKYNCSPALICNISKQKK